MKDVTITSFGLIIAYLLPGFLGLYGLSFWFAPLRATFATFATAESNVGLFLIVVLASLIAGLFANGIRWLVFERWCSGSGRRLDARLYAQLSGERKLSAFRTTVDELYRYHQWWGGTAVWAPVGFIGWILSDGSQLAYGKKIVLSISFITVEAFLIYTAWSIGTRSLTNLRSVLQGDNNMGGVPLTPPPPTPPSPGPSR